MSRGPNAPPPGIFPPCHGSDAQCDYGVGDGTVAYSTWYRMLKKYHGATDKEYEMWKLLS